jgi:hypothetical protein
MDAATPRGRLDGDLHPDGHALHIMYRSHDVRFCQMDEASNQIEWAVTMADL